MAVPAALAGLGAILPGAILFGTFVPLWHPSLAIALVLLAAVTTPVLAVVALLGVARTRRAPAIVSAFAVLGAAALAGGTPRQLSLTIITALGSLAVGVGLTRLIPRRWLVVGIVLMAALDVLLLATGLGELAAGSLDAARADVAGAQFSQAAIGPAALDYPDLALASILGGVVAGGPLQRQAAVVLANLAAGAAMLLAFVSTVPATVPIALTFAVTAVREHGAHPRMARRMLSVWSGDRAGCGA